MNKYIIKVFKRQRQNQKLNNKVSYYLDAAELMYSLTSYSDLLEREIVYVFASSFCKNMTSKQKKTYKTSQGQNKKCKFLFINYKQQAMYGVI